MTFSNLNGFNVLYDSQVETKNIIVKNFQLKKSFPIFSVRSRNPHYRCILLKININIKIRVMSIPFWDTTTT